MTSVSGRTLPLEAYIPTAAQAEVIGRAEDRLSNQCMSRFGFQLPPRSNAASAQTRQLDRAYGAVDADLAVRYGYHPPDIVGRSNHKQRRGPQISGNELLVLSGADNNGRVIARSYQGIPIPAGGCMAWANQQVSGHDNLDPGGLAFDLIVGMGKKAQADPRVVKVTAAWSRCMAAHGYRYGDPLKAAEDSRWYAGSGATTPTAAEIHAATTDVACKQKVNYIGVRYTVESAYETEAIQANIQQLTAFITQWNQAAKKAAQMLGVPEPTAPNKPR
jgi:hypothetical protein